MKKIYFTALVLGTTIAAKAQVYDVGSYAQVVDISNTGIAVGNIYGSVHFMWSEDEGLQEFGEAPDSGTSGNGQFLQMVL